MNDSKTFISIIFVGGILIWMALISIFCIHAYIQLRNIRCRLKDENNDTVLSTELITFNDIILEIILSNLSYEKQSMRAVISLGIPILIFSIYGILCYLGSDETLSVIIYTLFLFFLIVFRYKMLNELNIEEYANKIFERKAEDIERNFHDYEKMISLEKDTFPLIAISFSVGTYLMKEMIEILCRNLFVDIANELTFLMAYSIFIYVIYIVAPNYIYISFCSTKIKELLNEK